MCIYNFETINIDKIINWRKDLKKYDQSLITEKLSIKKDLNKCEEKISFFLISISNYVHNVFHHFSLVKIFIKILDQF